jgi:hypothetical protein
MNAADLAAGASLAEWSVLDDLVLDGGPEAVTRVGLVGPLAVTRLRARYDAIATAPDPVRISTHRELRLANQSVNRPTDRAELRLG